MYVCMYVCMYVMYVCMYVCTLASNFECIYVCMYVCMYNDAFVYACVYACLLCVGTYVWLLRLCGCGRLGVNVMCLVLLPVDAGHGFVLTIKDVSAFDGRKKSMFAHHSLPQFYFIPCCECINLCIYINTYI